MLKIGVILPAAGSGLRFGSPIPKQYQLLGDTPILIRTLRTALSVRGVVAVVVPLSAGDAWFADMCALYDVRDDRICSLLGGTERQHSVALALDDSALKDVNVILVHDAVRPLASVELFERVAEAAFESGAAVPCVAISDTVKRIHDSNVIETLDRSELRRVQTPQGFRAEVLRAAYSRFRATDGLSTDDSSVVERAGYPILCVEGESGNEKITEPIDLIRAESVLRVYSRPL